MVFKGMVLDPTARGKLEEYIDWFINMGIPNLMPRFREKEFKNILHFQNEDDFLYGVAYGAIIFGHYEKFVATFHRSPTQEEMLEIQTVIASRMRDVKYAIYKTG